MKIRYTMVWCLTALASFVSYPLLARELQKNKKISESRLLGEIEELPIIAALARIGIDHALAEEILKLMKPTFYTLSMQQQEEVLETIKTLLEDGAHPNVLIEIDEIVFPVTPLYIAVNNSVPDAIKILLAHGATTEYSYREDDGQEENVNIVSISLQQFTDLSLKAILDYPEDSLSISPTLSEGYKVLSLLIPDQEERKQKIMDYATGSIDESTVKDLNRRRKNRILVAYRHDHDTREVALKKMFTKKLTLEAIATLLKTIDPKKHIWDID